MFTTTHLPVFSVLLIIFVSSSWSVANVISPANFITIGSFNENQTPITLSSADFNSKKIENISSTYLQYNSNIPNHFYGMVIYFKTGVIYANYLIEEAENTYSSYLMALNSTSGEMIFDRLKYSDGVNTYGFAIDQYSGDIHFLNHTNKLDRSDRYTVDWCVWNANTEITTIIQKNANKNETGFGTIVFDPIEHSLYTQKAGSSQITVYNQILYPNNAAYYSSSLVFSYLTVNPKNGEIYAIIKFITENNELALQLSSLHLNPVQQTIERKDGFCQFDATSSFGIATDSNSSDFDYYSNSWAASFSVISADFNSNMLLSVQISDSTCEFFSIINENAQQQTFASLRFNSPDFNY